MNDDELGTGNLDTDTCKHCGLPIFFMPGWKWLHNAGSNTVSVTCTSAVADAHRGPWTDELVARRESLKRKSATPTISRKNKAILDSAIKAMGI
jgi:hypothetical protein